MAKQRRYKNAADKRDGGRFIQLPVDVLNSRAYLSLSAHGRMLLLDLNVQYKGDNNGKLAVPWKQVKLRGWKSETTLLKAKAELLAAQLIVETRKGGRPNKVSYYALTYYALDDFGSLLDMAASVFPRGAWRLMDPVPPVKMGGSGASLTTPAVVGAP